MNTPTTITVWQVCVEGDWRYATPATAAMVETLRDGCVRLVDMPVPHAPRFDRMKRVELPEATGRRRAAAARAIKAAGERAGLFAALDPQANETVDQRLQRHRDRVAREHDESRRHRAQLWKEARRLLAGLADHERAGVLFKWNTSLCPAVPEFLFGMIHQATRAA